MEAEGPARRRVLGQARRRGGLALLLVRPPPHPTTRPAASRRERAVRPTDLDGPEPGATPLLQRRYNATANLPDFCSNSIALSKILHECDPGCKTAAWCPGRAPAPAPAPTPPCVNGRCPVHVFPGGHIPSLVFVPSDDGAGNGTLTAFSEWVGPCPTSGGGGKAGSCSLGARSSTDLGETWAAPVFPADEGMGDPMPGPRSHFCCPMSVFDPSTGDPSSVILQFSNSTSVKGGCDLGSEQLGGVMQVKSTDAGRSWGAYENVQTQLEFPKKPLNCLAPTSGAGLVMRPVGGKFGGRLVFCAV